MDDEDKRRAYAAQVEALERGPSGTPVAWRNPDSGRYGNIVPGPAYQQAGGQCDAEAQEKAVEGQDGQGQGDEAVTDVVPSAEGPHAAPEQHGSGDHPAGPVDEQDVEDECSCKGEHGLPIGGVCEVNVLAAFHFALATAENVDSQQDCADHQKPGNDEGNCLGPYGVRLRIRGYQAVGVEEDNDAYRAEQEGYPQLGAAFEACC